jgi:hypothetical protein
MIGTAAAALLAGGMGASVFGSLFGASKAAKAAKEAARLQAEAAGKAAAGVDEATGNVNPMIAAAGGEAGNSVVDTAGKAAENISNTTGKANALLESLFSPYTKAGAGTVDYLSTLLAPGGEFNKSFGTEDFQADPGYAFRMQEGQKALERSAAARGSVMGGAALKSLDRFSQGLASQEYNNAFNRFMQGREMRYNMLAGVSGMGLNAANTYGTTASNNMMRGEMYADDARMRAAEFKGNTDINTAGMVGGNLLNAAKYRGDTLMGAGNANAAGVVGSANAWNGALGSMGNTAQWLGSMLMLGNRAPQQYEQPLSVGAPIPAPNVKFNPQAMPPVTPPFNPPPPNSPIWQYFIGGYPGGRP